MFHVLVGEQATVALFEEAADRQASVPWIVPKAARPGDEVAVYFPPAGFRGSGVVVSVPVATTFGDRQVYRADVGSLAWFQTPVLLAEVARLLPEWGWVRYPRSFTTPPQELVGRLRGLLCVGTEAEPGAAADRRGMLAFPGPRFSSPAGC